MKRMTITWRMALYFTAVFLAQLLLIGVFGFRISSTAMRELLLEKLTDVNTVLAHELNYVQGINETISDRILVNKVLQGLLKETPQSQYELVTLRQQVENLLYDPNNHGNAMILSTSDILFFSGSRGATRPPEAEVKKMPAYIRAQLSKGENLWVAGAPGDGWLYLSRTINALSPGYQDLGKLIIEVPLEDVSRILSSTQDSASLEYYAVLNAQDEYLYHSSDPEQTGREADAELLALLKERPGEYIHTRESGVDLLLAYMPGRPGGWKLIHGYPVALIAQRATKLSGALLFLLILSMLSAPPMLYLLSRSIIKPVRRLKLTLDAFGNGDLNTRSVVTGHDEIGHLQTSFNSMADEINNLLERVEEEHRQRNRLELDMLEYQINPHFLYNSLDTINWMAATSGNAEISQMAVALARYFRLGLTKGQGLHSLRDEMEHVRQFLAIYQIRFGNSFSYSVSLPEELSNILTIKFLLQPLAENAIKHGLSKQNGMSGHIGVAARRAGNDLFLEVANDGQCLLPARLHEIQMILASNEKSDEQSSFGFYALKKRIRAHYGHGYGLTIARENGQTIVTVRIPYNPEKHAGMVE